MSREIRFRAWDKKDKVMREVYGVMFERISNKGNRGGDMVEMHCSDYEGSSIWHLWDDSGRNIEVIGNIYENPELLEEK